MTKYDRSQGRFELGITLRDLMMNVFRVRGKEKIIHVSLTELDVKYLLHFLRMAKDATSFEIVDEYIEKLTPYVDISAWVEWVRSLPDEPPTEDHEPQG